MFVMAAIPISKFSEVRLILGSVGYKYNKKALQKLKGVSQYL